MLFASLRINNYSIIIALTGILTSLCVPSSVTSESEVSGLLLQHDWMYFFVPLGHYNWLCTPSNVMAIHRIPFNVRKHGGELMHKQEDLERHVSERGKNVVNTCTNSKTGTIFTQAKKETEKAKTGEGGEECDCGRAPQGDSGIACLKPSHQWAGSLGS